MESRTEPTSNLSRTLVECATADRERLAAMPFGLLSKGKVFGAAKLFTAACGEFDLALLAVG
jgi:hypothetical protein